MADGSGVSDRQCNPASCAYTRVHNGVPVDHGPCPCVTSSAGTPGRSSRAGASKQCRQRSIARKGAKYVRTGQNRAGAPLCGSLKPHAEDQVEAARQSPDHWSQPDEREREREQGTPEMPRLTRDTASRSTRGQGPCSLSGAGQCFLFRCRAPGDGQRHQLQLGEDAWDHYYHLDGGASAFPS